MPIDARKILANVNPKYYFWVCDGQIIKNLQELAKALSKMNNNVFRYHVNKDRNDFKAWVKDLLNDPILTREVSKAKTPSVLAKVVKQRLDFLKKKRKKQLIEKKKPVVKKVKIDVKRKKISKKKTTKKIKKKKIAKKKVHKMKAKKKPKKKIVKIKKKTVKKKAKKVLKKRPVKKKLKK